MRFFYLVYAILLVAGLAGLVATIYLNDPFTALPGVFILLYSCIFLVSGAFSGLILAAISGAIYPNTGPRRKKVLIFRQSILLGMVSTLAFLFQSFRILNLYTALLLVVSAGFLELFFLNS